MPLGPTAAPVPDNSITTAGSQREYVVVLGSPIGIPQLIAGALLALFLAQCVWLAVHSPMREMEMEQIERGEFLFHEHAFAA
ncbi:MAG: hypothetical protein ACXVZJ_08785 [Terriglobales bacterium]